MSDEQDKLAEEWAAALEAQEDTEAPAEAGGEAADNDKLAEEWAAALAGDEQQDLKKEKEQDFFSQVAKEAKFKDMTEDAKTPRPEGERRELDFILYRFLQLQV